MIRRCRIVLVNGLDETHRLMDGDRGELHTVGHIAQSIDVRHVRARIGIHRDLALLADRHAGLVEPEVLGVRHTAQCQHHLIDDQLITIVEGCLETIVFGLLDLGEDTLAENPDSLVSHRLVKAFAHIAVEARQDFLAAIDERGLHSEAVEDIGEFDRDVAAARDRDCLGQFVEVKRLVGTDAKFVTRQRFMRIGPTADGNDDALRGHSLAGRLQQDFVRTDEFGAAVDHFRARIVEALAIEPFKAVDLLVLVGNQRRPVERTLAHAPAETGGVVEVLGELRGIDEKLLGHAAADHAGAAIAILFGDRDLLAEACSHATGAHATRTASDDEEIVVV